MRGDQFFGRDGQRLCGAKKVGFVVGEKFEDRREYRWVVQSRAQAIRVEPRQRKEAFRAVTVLQDPAKHSQGQGGGAGAGLGTGGFIRQIGGDGDCGDLSAGLG